MSFRWSDEIVLITGASSGLGKALALKISELKSSIILVARNKERLTQVNNEIVSGGGSSFVFQFDLQEVGKIPQLYKSIVEEVKNAPTMLINNAGYRVAGFVQNTPIELYERNYLVNTLAPVALIQCVLPDMLRQKKGLIVNIMGGQMFHSFPGLSSYWASKEAFGAIHESLKTELSGLPVKTLYISPCGFISNSWKNTDFGDRLKGYRFKKGEKRTAQDVASEIVKTIELGKEKNNIEPLRNKIGYRLKYWAPRLFDKIVSIRNKKLTKKRPDV